MKVFGVFRKAGKKAQLARQDRDVDADLRAHLDEFVRTRRGVEAWIESPTDFNPPSLLLVAHDGEWTRRQIPSPAWGHQYADKLGVPAYDAGVVSYPQRMRDWDLRRRKRG